RAGYSDRRLEPVSRLVRRSLGPLQVGEAGQQPLDALAGECDGDLLVVLDQLGTDDDTLAEQRVAHLLPREKGGVARRRGPGRLALRWSDRLRRLALRRHAPRAGGAHAAIGEHTGLQSRGLAALGRML